MPEDKIRAKVQLGISKPASEIFESIVDPEKMSKYFISGSTGRMESGKTLTWTWSDYEASTKLKWVKLKKIKLFHLNGLAAE